MDIATLGLEVDSRGVKSATNDLSSFTNASRIAQRAASGLADATGKFSSSEIKAMEAAMGGVEKISTAASKALAAASLAAQRVGSLGASGVKAFAQSAGAARQQVQNLSFQLQDIITMLLSGQAPFMLLAQQLPQVVQNGGQLNGVLSAVKQTLLGFISPLGIATTAFVLLGSAAVSYFSEWMNKGSSSNTVLKDQAQLIQTVADRWGDAIPALRAYADQLKRAQEAADLKQGLGFANDNTLQSVRQGVESARVSIADLTSQLRSAGEEASVIKALEDSFASFADKANEGKVQISDVESVQNSLSSAINSSGIPALQSFSSFFDLLSEAALRATGNVNSAMEAASVAASRINDPSTWRSAGRSDQFGADATIQGTAFPLPDVGPTPDRRPTVELSGLPKVKGSGGAKQKAYDTATASITEQTRALQAQTAAQATLNPLVSDFGFAVAKAKVETDLLLAAEKDKRAITPELTAQISAQAESYAQAVVEQNKLTEATKKAQESMQFAKSTAAGFVNELRNGLRNGESFWEAFGNAAISVLDRITDRLLNEVLDAVFQVSNAGTSSGGGLLSSLFGGLFGGGKSSFPALPAIGPIPSTRYATGTASARAGLALVGEEGPEVVRFGGGEKVIPNHRLGSGLTGQTMQAANQNVTLAPVYQIDARGADAAAVARIQAGLDKTNQNMKATIVDTVRKAQKGNVKLG